MIPKSEGKVIVWPVYFDSRLPRSLGRKVPKSLAVENPKVDEIAEIAHELGLEPEIIRGKRYPSVWWEEYGGYVLVKKVTGKYQLLKLIAEKLVEKRRKSR